MGLAPDITAAFVVGHGALKLTFADGTTGEVDVLDRMRGPVFEEARKPEGFAKVTVDRETGTVVWPGGADLAPDTLYERVRTGPGHRIPLRRRGPPAAEPPLATPPTPDPGRNSAVAGAAPLAPAFRPFRGSPAPAEVAAGILEGVKAVEEDIFRPDLTGDGGALVRCRRRLSLAAGRP
jgi:hypothetical protein